MSVIYYIAFGDYSDYRPVGRFRNGEWDVVLYEDKIPRVYEEYEHAEKLLLMDADGPTSYAIDEKEVPRDYSGGNNLGPTFETLSELNKSLPVG